MVARSSLFDSGRPSAALALLGLALVACSQGEPLPFEPAGPDAAPDPKALGPYPVGVRTVTLFDPTRKTPGMTTPRKLVTEIWYPAVEAARGQPGRVYRVRDILSDETIRTASITLDLEFATDAVLDAEPRAEDGPFPVVFFSHGANAMRMQSTYVLPWLASHGYVVISPDHEGNLLEDIVKAGGELELSIYPELLYLRPDDIRFLMEHFRLLDPPDPMAGLADFSKVGVFGHSFGALTTARVAAMADAQYPVHCAIAQAPPTHGLSLLGVETPLSAQRFPIMIQGGTLDRTTTVDQARSYWPELSVPRMELILETAGHFTFSDLCRIDPALIAQVTESNALTDGCGPENVPYEKSSIVLRHFTIGAFNAFLRGSTATEALLEPGAAPPLADVPMTWRAEL
jgi:dienelactone hydrolase